MNDTTDEQFEALVRYLRDSRGFDFTGYKRASLIRRVRHRMEQAGCVSFEQYLDILQTNSDEFAALFNTVLINVTAFFRDQGAWDFLASDVIPRLLADRGPDDPIRVWSAGCASGQEAYSLTMLLVEAMGADAFRQRVKIYATDIDEEALREARTASYDAKAMESVPSEFLHRYFQRVGERHVFNQDLRRSVIFGRNDLVKDAPISRVDLLICRNTLIYLNAETQRDVLSRLHFALAPAGILFLGRAEMLLSHTAEFAPLNLAHRLFVKAAGSRDAPDCHDRKLACLERPGKAPDLTRLRDLTFRASPVAQIVITSEDTVAMINQRAEAVFDLSPRDIGRSLRDLEVSYRPVELRGYLEQAKVERRPARIPEAKWQRPGLDTVWFEIIVNPLVDAGNGLLGVSIAYFDVTATRTLLDKVVHTHRQLETAYEELQSTNEELETTNEELQSMVEELETTNEELQSTNEELETMNEELQSANDELHTSRTALRERSGQLDDARGFLDALITAVPQGLVVVDREMRVVMWNRACEDLWGLRSDETIGTKLTALDFGLPMQNVLRMVGNAFVDKAGSGESVVDAVDRRGRPARVRVICTSLPDPNGGIGGSLLLIEVLG